MQLSKSQISAPLIEVASQEDGFNEILRMTIAALMKAARVEHLAESTRDKGNGFRTAVFPSDFRSGLRISPINKKRPPISGGPCGHRTCPGLHREGLESPTFPIVKRDTPYQLSYAPKTSSSTAFRDFHRLIWRSNACASFLLSNALLKTNSQSFAFEV